MKGTPAVPKDVGKICYIIALILIVALPVRFFQVVRAAETFTSSDYFTIPELHGRISFREGGSYTTASLNNSTWDFTGLTFGGAKSVFPNFEGTKFSVSAQNCDMTITRLDVLNIFPPFSGWLEYTVAGIGMQTVNLRYAMNEWLSYTIYVDGVARAQNDGWTVTKDGWITVTGATSTVRIQYAQASLNLTSADIFTIPARSSFINFAFNGTYVYAILEKDTWRFQNLYMNGYKPTSGVPTWALGVSAQDCNVTITSYSALANQVDPSLINYAVAGVGKQILKIDYDRHSSWPINYTVNIDGAAKAQNDSWNLSNDGWLTVTGATSNVSIGFTAIEPDWLRDAPSRGGLEPTTRSDQNLYTIIAGAVFISIIAATAGILVLRRKKKNPASALK